MDWLRNRLEWPDGDFKGNLLDLLSEAAVQGILRRQLSLRPHYDQERLPKLRPVKHNPLLTQDYLEPTWGLEKAVNRVIGQLLSEKYLGTGILSLPKAYPPAGLKQTPRKMGRRMKYHRPMTPAERKRRQRNKAIFHLRKHSGGILPDSGKPYEPPSHQPPPWQRLNFLAPQPFSKVSPMDYKPDPRPVAEGDDFEMPPIRVICYGNGDQFVGTDDGETLGISARGPKALTTLARRLLQAGFDGRRTLVLFKGGQRVGATTIAAAAGIGEA